MAAGEATPTGSITFLNDGLPISSCPPLELDSGRASCSAGAGVTGRLTADYSGDATFDGSSSQQIGTLPVTYVGNGATSGAVPVDGASPYSSSATVTVLGPGTLTQGRIQLFRLEHKTRRQRFLLRPGGHLHNPGQHGTLCRLDADD